VHRLRAILVALFAAPWLLWAVVRTLALDGGHPLVAMISFTPYVAVTAIVPLLVALVTRQWIVAAFATLALALFALALAPRALDGPQRAGDGARGRSLVVMTANLRFGGADAHTIVRLARVHDVDVLSLQELTPGAVQRLDRAGIRQVLRARVLHPRESAVGAGLMARRPLRAIVRPRDGSPEQLQAALLLSGDEELGLASVHPLPPLSAESTAAWRDVLRALPGPLEDQPNILAGDFNATLDHRDLRRLLARGYTDAADATGDGLRPTFPIVRSLPPITIDHVLVPDTIRVRRVQTHAVKGSDHRALIAELVLPAKLSSGRAPVPRAP
jgi:endonuclease/exonuclease/phosphatase (EEP) superfamily protein YafD